MKNNFPNITAVSAECFEQCTNFATIDLPLIPMTKSAIDHIRAIIDGQNKDNALSELYFELSCGSLQHEHVQISITYISELRDSETLISLISDFSLSKSNRSHLIYCLPFIQVLRDLMQWQYSESNVRDNLFSFGRNTRNKKLYFELKKQHIVFYKNADGNKFMEIYTLNQSEIMVMNRYNCKAVFANILANIFERNEN